MFDTHKQTVALIGTYALQHYTLQEKSEMRDELTRIAFDLNADIERILAMPSHGLLAYIGKSPEEIATIKEQIEAQTIAQYGSEPEQKIAPVDDGGDAV